MTGYWIHIAGGLAIIWGSLAVMVAQSIQIYAQKFTIACQRERLARLGRTFDALASAAGDDRGDGWSGTHDPVDAPDLALRGSDPEPARS